MDCIEKTNARLQRAWKALDSVQHLLYFLSSGQKGRRSTGTYAVRL